MLQLTISSILARNKHKNQTPEDEYQSLLSLQSEGPLFIKAVAKTMVDQIRQSTSLVDESSVTIDDTCTKDCLTFKREIGLSNFLPIEVESAFNAESKGSITQDIITSDNDNTTDPTAQLGMEIVPIPMGNESNSNSAKVQVFLKTAQDNDPMDTEENKTGNIGSRLVIRKY